MICIRVTRGRDANFISPKSDELSISLTGHLEEVHTSWGLLNTFDLRSFHRFSVHRRRQDRPYRIFGRDGSFAPVVELIIRLPRWTAYPGSQRASKLPRACYDM